MRIGTGYDVHKLVENRKLILGGVEIPYEKGLLGHSDADVLIHAVMDSILGAAALGDIGQHFPDSDDAYKGISSIRFHCRQSRGAPPPAPLEHSPPGSERLCLKKVHLPGIAPPVCSAGRKC